MLNQLAKEIYQGNKAKGFWPENPADRNVGECLMLMTSELAEALEADRKGLNVTEGAAKTAMAILGNQTLAIESKEDEEILEQFKTFFKSDVKDTFEDELADTMIRILDYCGAMDIDIENHIKAKLAYNATRAHKHGKAY